MRINVETKELQIRLLERKNMKEIAVNIVHMQRHVAGVSDHITERNEDLSR